MKTIFTAKTAAAIAALALLAGTATRADAIILHGSYGFVGLTAGQALRLAVAHVGNPNESRGQRCGVEWAFFDLTGAVVGSGEARLEPGTGVVADLRAAELGGPDTRPGDRFEIRVEVGATGADRDAKFCANNLRPTLQLFDEESGRTAVAVDPSDPS